MTGDGDDHNDASTMGWTFGVAGCESTTADGSMRRQGEVRPVEELAWLNERRSWRKGDNASKGWGKFARGRGGATAQDGLARVATGVTVAADAAWLRRRCDGGAGGGAKQRHEEEEEVEVQQR
ncbi:Solute carrier family 40 protein [Psidium guajava]|nr:Solute carrier family 40 protein [Psidium guajava]